MLPFSTAAAAAGFGNDDREVECVTGIERSAAVHEVVLECVSDFGLRCAATGGAGFVATTQNTVTAMTQNPESRNNRGPYTS